MKATLFIDGQKYPLGHTQLEAVAEVSSDPNLLAALAGHPCSRVREKAAFNMYTPSAALLNMANDEHEGVVIALLSHRKFIEEATDADLRNSSCEMRRMTPSVSFGRTPRVTGLRSVSQLHSVIAVVNR